MTVGTAVDFGEWGSAEALSIEGLNIDPSYQRTLRHDLVRNIAEHFSKEKAGPILVNRRSDGTLWVVDGQHRMTGADQAGEKTILANVVAGLSEQQEAELRLARNDRRSDTIYEKFRTRLVMGDETAHRLVEIAHQFDTQINLEANMNKGINSIAATEQLYRLDYGASLMKVLKALQDMFLEDGGGLHGRNVTFAMIKSTYWFLDRHVVSKEANYNEWIERVARVGVHDLDRKARGYKAAMGGSLWLNYYRAMVEVYNFNRQEKNKLEWKTTGSAGVLGSNDSGRATGFPSRKSTGSHDSSR